MNARGTRRTTERRSICILRTPVIVINEAMARQVFPDEDPIGRRLTIVDRNARDVVTSREIVVGIVGNVLH